MLNTGILLDKLQIDNIIPVYKKEDDTLFTNYRRISLLPIISKLFDKMFDITLQL